MMREPQLDGMIQTSRDRPDPILRPGSTNCGGCGMSIVLNMLTHAAGPTPIQMAMPACCAIVAAGPFPYSGYSVPVFACAFGSTAAAATGLAHAARLNGEPTRVVAVSGDGAAYDIGMSPISAAAERNEDILFLCYDNEIYGNTVWQRSSATPLGAVTTTTPRGKLSGKKDMVQIMAAHEIPYAATMSLAHPDDTLRKMRLALDLHGFRFLHVLSPCPTGWKSEPSEGIELVRLAVRSGLYPVYEVFDGNRVVINVEPEMSLPALEKYFAGQGRFRKTGVEIGNVRSAIEQSWARLRARAA
jgi:pyruvate ferredoxin oxidoreductase beta subunit/2-oxoisovalerate ferredoxin oxidoreductase beta subunit